MRKLALIVAFVWLAACKKDIQNKEAVRGSILEYLKQRQAQTGLTMDSMQVDVTSLLFSANGEQAQATVTFTPKGGGGGMQLPYTLDRKDNKWVVRAHAEGDNPHGGAMPQVGTPSPHGGGAMPPLPSLPPPDKKQ